MPVSIYGGIAFRERSLAKEIDQVPESRNIVKERAVKARIAQWVLQIGRWLRRRLEQERKELLAEGRDLDMKLEDVRKRLSKSKA